MVYEVAVLAVPIASLIFALSTRNPFVLFFASIVAALYAGLIYLSYLADLTDIGPAVLASFLGPVLLVSSLLLALLSWLVSRPGGSR